ncbi:hypothetical protein CDAR_565611 [Caerostris darwini]|uniref:Uncharacterized protein n=1 Tax=Caerostris darwini TaxID=1538125 RepID=A0AAV4UYY1_9ARAC|nr:hypothetical protein CDAR_565611 [Caerostris darwini]
MFIYRRYDSIAHNEEEYSSIGGVMASSAQGKQKKKIKAAAAASPTKISFSFGSLLKEKWWHICSAPLAANAESHLDPKDDPADNYQPAGVVNGYAHVISMESAVPPGLQEFTCLQKTP